MTTNAEVEALFDAVRKEFEAAIKLHPPIHSAHEGLAVIEEEMAELRSGVYKGIGRRDPAAMNAEAIQVAAMALRFVFDGVADKQHGRNTEGANHGR